MELKDNRAAQYIRMSTDMQRYSLENQSEAIATYALKHGLTIVRSYEDAGRSAGLASRVGRGNRDRSRCGRLHNQGS